MRNKILLDRFLFLQKEIVQSQEGQYLKKGRIERRMRKNIRREMHFYIYLTMIINIQKDFS